MRPEARIGVRVAVTAAGERVAVGRRGVMDGGIGVRVSVGVAVETAVDVAVAEGGKGVVDASIS